MHTPVWRTVISLFWSNTLFCVCTGAGPRFLSLLFFLSFISFSPCLFFYDLGWMVSIVCMSACVYLVLSGVCILTHRVWTDWVYFEGCIQIRSGRQGHS